MIYPHASGIGSDCLFHNHKIPDAYAPGAEVVHNATSFVFGMQVLNQHLTSFSGDSRKIHD